MAKYQSEIYQFLQLKMDKLTVMRMNNYKLKSALIKVLLSFCHYMDSSFKILQMLFNQGFLPT